MAYDCSDTVQYPLESYNIFNAIWLLARNYYNTRRHNIKEKHNIDNTSQ